MYDRKETFIFGVGGAQLEHELALLSQGENGSLLLKNNERFVTSSHPAKTRMKNDKRSQINSVIIKAC